MSKRADNEKKTITKSFKISREHLAVIESNAKENGMNFSRYMIDCAIHNETKITPEIVCRLENIISRCIEYITDNNEKESIESETDSLWELLK